MPHAGLDPSIYECGKVNRVGRISKQGLALLRWQPVRRPGALAAMVDVYDHEPRAHFAPGLTEAASGNAPDGPGVSRTQANHGEANVRGTALRLRARQGVSRRPFPPGKLKAV